MKIIRSPQDWPESAHGSVMALGNFDGVHLGHQAVLARARALAEQAGRPLAVMTFEPHPRRFFNPSLPVLRIAPFAEKARLLRKAGVEYLFVARFNRQFAQMEPESFISRLLRETLRVAHVVTGHDFAFGHRRRGDGAMLRREAEMQGFTYTAITAVGGEGGTVYSSSAVRAALENGDIAAASAILGRPYQVYGRVMRGAQRGRQLGFPTANIRPPQLFLPRGGVYAVRLETENAVYDGVANLGTRPTVDGSRKWLEAHVFDASPDLYGQRVAVRFGQFLREERKFDGLDALRAQIAADCAAARAWLADNRVEA